jgi:uncharacterized protein (TIGR00266 family)
MQIEFQYKPGNAVAKVKLAAGEIITAEGGAMVAMSPNMDIQTTTRQRKSDGLFSSVKRLLASESFFFNHFTARDREAEIFLGTSLPGDMTTLAVDSKKIYVQGGSYVASSQEVRFETVWRGAKNLLSGESLFWIELSGQGTAIINAFGVIYPIDIDGEYIVDTGHIVAYEEGLDYNISKAGASWLSSFLGGEGFVCKFSGRGRVWCQSHSSGSFGQQLTPHLKVLKSS